MSNEREPLFKCVYCKRKLPRDQVVGYTHVFNWTYICRDYVGCARAQEASERA